MSQALESQIPRPPTPVLKPCLHPGRWAPPLRARPRPVLRFPAFNLLSSQPAIPTPPLCLPRNPLKFPPVITAPSFLVASYDPASPWFLNPTPSPPPCLGPSGRSGTLYPSMTMGPPDATARGSFPWCFLRKQQDRGPVLGRRLSPQREARGNPTKEVLVWPRDIGDAESPPTPYLRTQASP